MTRTRLRTVLIAALAAALVAALVPALAPTTAHAELTLPRLSPKASVSQTIGLTDLKVTYSRPAVKGRTIWGGLVPYNEVWRTGANEATTFECSDAVVIGGKTLPAGSYALYTIPTPNEWTVIFSKVKEAWGSFEYSPAQDALRYTAKPETAPQQEWMSISFENLGTSGGDLVIRWEALKVAVPLQVNTIEKAMASIREAMGTLKPDDWRTPYRAAQFCFTADLNPAESMKWAERSVSTNANYLNLSLLADMKMKAGMTKEAIAAAEKAVQAGKADKDKPDTRPTERKLTEWKSKM
jgi:hypothetical protein